MTAAPPSGNSASVAVNYADVAPAMQADVNEDDHLGQDDASLMHYADSVSGLSALRLAGLRGSLLEGLMPEGSRNDMLYLRALQQAENLSR